MKKVWVIAAREYRTMVATKTFLISLIMMPLLMMGSMVLMTLLKDIGEVKHRTILVADASEKLLGLLQEKATIHNQRIEAQAAAAKTDGADSGSDSPFDSANGELYTLQATPQSQLSDEQRLEISDRIRDENLYAFVEIPAQILADPATMANTTDLRVKFYSLDSSIASARQWLSQVINELVREQRLQAKGIDFQLVQIASQPVPVVNMGLVNRDVDGQVAQAQEKQGMTDIFLPLIMMMFMFMVIFMSSQPMLESVIEEKSQRIAEVLLGSANPFQLMAGKLLGTVGGSLTIFAIYIIGGWFVAQDRGWLDQFPFHLVPWFIAFQVLGVLFYAAIFLAVGASVSQLKEAQSLLLPVWMVLMLPLFVWLLIVRDPNGPLAFGLTFFPPSTSTTIILRLATGQTIPLAEILIGLVLMIVATTIVVALAGRIFRVGILWQGKVPKLSELARWAFFG